MLLAPRPRASDALLSQRTLLLIKIEGRRLASTPARMSHAASTGASGAWPKDRSPSPGCAQAELT